VTVSSIPTSGGTLYARLSSLVNSQWVYTDSTFSEAATAAAAVITSPTPGSTLPTSSTVTFQWTAGVGVTSYALAVGTAGPASPSIYYASTTATQATVSGIPASGTLYVTLYSRINGATVSNAYTYQGYGPYQPATMRNPAPGSHLGNTTSVTLTWDPGTGVTATRLTVGTGGTGATNLYNADTSSLIQATITGLPTDGSRIYVTLSSLIAGTWQSVNYTYVTGP
jgi:hypothetical protein